jgi:molecular chaperone GrpE
VSTGEDQIPPAAEAAPTPEVVPEPPSPEVVRLQAQVAELEKKLEAAETQTRHFAQQFDRARTEFAASRERMQRENERRQKHEQGQVVKGLLDVLDTLDRSLESVRNQPPGQAFVDGVQMIRHQFEQALAALGLRRFDGLGEEFDPVRHQAVTTMPVLDQAQDNRVVHGVASGVMVGDEVVRVAQVVVGKYAGVEADSVN